MNREEMAQLKLDGETYAAIAAAAGLSRQRVQQLLAPPTFIRRKILEHYQYKCARCGILVGKSGHIHHDNNHPEILTEDYNDIANLELLCPSCHRRVHEGVGGIKSRTRLQKAAMARKKEDRNERVYQFKLKHPNWPLRSIGNLFGISHVRVIQILKARETEGQ